jgi:hypothetical protein
MTTLSATVVHAVLWVCPRCLRYYGASSAGDLRQEMNQDIHGQPTHSRAQCPFCHTERRPHYVEIELPDRLVTP